MKFNVKFILLIFIIFIPLHLISAFEKPLGYSGTIHFRDGTSVFFNYLGTLKGIGKCTIEGKLKSQNVTFSLGELREIHFSDKGQTYKQCGYNNCRGDLIIFNKQGEKFVLNNCYIRSV